MSEVLKKAEAELVDTENHAALEKFYTILLEDLVAIRDSLETMRQENDKKSDIFTVIEEEISNRLRNVNEWLDVAEKSANTGNLKLYTSTDEFRRLNRKVSVEIQSLINMTSGERSEGFGRLRGLFGELQKRIDSFENFVSIDMTGESIKIDRNGTVLECSKSLTNYKFKPWTTEERLDNLPVFENRMFLTFESDVFEVYTIDKTSTAPRWKEKKLIKVRLKDNAIVDDRIWITKIRVDKEWKTEDTIIDGDFAVFRTNAVESFFILSTPKEKEFIVSPTGCQYKHKADERVEINFPENAVHEQQHFKVQVFPVKVEEMRVRRASFPREYQFLSLSKGVHVEGKLNRSVELKVPLETIDEKAMKDEKDVEIVTFHVVGEKVERLTGTQIVREGHMVSTSVKEFSIIVHACVRRDSLNSVTGMEALIGLGIMHHCKLLTFYQKANERFIKLWCELVKKEDAERILNDRLQSDEGLGKIETIPKDVFIREEERIRVDITGNSEVNKTVVRMASLLMTFIPIADHNHIFIPADRKGGGAHYTTITYSKDRFGKGPLHSTSFDPWSSRNTTRPKVSRQLSTPSSSGDSSDQKKQQNIVSPKVQQPTSTQSNISRQRSTDSSSPSTSTQSSSVNKGSDSAQITTKASNMTKSLRSDKNESSNNTQTTSAPQTVQRESTDVETSSDFIGVDTNVEFHRFFKIHGLDDIKRKFEAEHFDRLDTMKNLTDDELKEIGLRMGERKKFIAAIRTLSQTVQRENTDTMAEFNKFFQIHGLNNIKHNFEAENFDRMDIMIDLTEHELKEIGLEKMGERKAFITAIEKFKGSTK